MGLRLLRVVSSCILTNFFMYPIIFEENYFIFLKMTYGLFFSKYFWNIFSEIYFINFIFINSEIKKLIPEKIFCNDFFSENIFFIQNSYSGII